MLHVVSCTQFKNALPKDERVDVTGVVLLADAGALVPAEDERQARRTTATDAHARLSRYPWRRHRSRHRGQAPLMSSPHLVESCRISCVN